MKTSLMSCHICSEVGHLRSLQSLVSGWVRGSDAGYPMDGFVLVILNSVFVLCPVGLPYHGTVTESGAYQAQVNYLPQLLGTLLCFFLSDESCASTAIECRCKCVHMSDELEWFVYQDAQVGCTVHLLKHDVFELVESFFFISGGHYVAIFGVDTHSLALLPYF